MWFIAQKLAVDAMVTNVKKHDFGLRFVQKSKQDPVSAIYRKTPLFLELSMQPMGIQTNIKRVTPKERYTFLRLLFNLLIKPAVASTEMRVVIDNHSERRDRSVGSLPARLSARASRDHRKTSFSLTAAPSARATREINCFLGNTISSPSRSISFESLRVKVFMQ
ncbi:MAG TPA: hypothetical protein VJJ55_03135 [Candidatus Paceibacterota bacterium]